MQALVCLVRGAKPVSTESVVEMLQEHQALGSVGGRPFVESLVAPGADLEEAKTQLRNRFLPVEDEPIVRFARNALEGPA